MTTGMVHRSGIKGSIRSSLIVDLEEWLLPVAALQTRVSCMRIAVTSFMFNILAG